MSITLTGKTIKLAPMSDVHYPTLQATVLKHPLVYQYTTLGVTPVDFARWFVLAQQHLAWVVLLKTNDQPIGSTRLYNKDNKTASVYMGYTWYHPDYRGTGVNAEVKYLLLKHVFETLDLKRVQFDIDADNIASRKAVEKLGAKLEGVLRQSRLRMNGKLANSCVYSLLIDEWLIIKSSLKQKAGIT